MLGGTALAQEFGSANPSVAESIGREVQALFQKCQTAIVRIEASDSHGKLSGSGFFIDPNGTIYTSYSVGGESHAIVVHHGAQKYPAKCIVSDQRSGIAILKVEAVTPFLMPGRSRGLSLAAPVLTIGYPLDLPLTPSFGTIGGFDINVGNSYFATRHIRANLPVQRGEGGAPLLNMQGEVIGILIASLDGGRASYALPIEAAEKVRMDFLRFGDVRPGWIGIEIEPGEAISGSTARVADLLPEGPGVRAGLRKGDVILKVGDRTVQSPEDVRDAAFFITAQDELGITVLRDGGELQLAVQPVDPPGATRTAFGGQQPPAPMPTLSQPEVRASLPLHQDP